MVKKDNKRRLPYNIWVNVIGFIICLAISGIGLGVFSIGLDADQRAVEDSEYVFGEWGYHFEYTYSDVETRSNWQDSICRGLMIIVGIAIAVLGVIVWIKYSEKYYWHYYEDC